MRSQEDAGLDAEAQNALARNASTFLLAAIRELADQLNAVADAADKTQAILSIPAERSLVRLHACTPLRSLRAEQLQPQHRLGINLRHMGLLRSLLLPQSTGRSILLVEMVARTVKHIIRAKLAAMRATAWKLQRRPSDFEVRSLAASVMNMVRPPCPALPWPALRTRRSQVSGADPDAASFWREELTPKLMLRYGSVALSPSEAADLFATCVVGIRCAPRRAASAQSATRLASDPAPAQPAAAVRERDRGGDEEQGAALQRGRRLCGLRHEGAPGQRARSAASAQHRARAGEQ